MNASEIRAMRGDKDGYEDSRNRQDGFWLSEIALQMAEANQLARLRLAIAYQESSARLPGNLCAEIEEAVTGQPRIEDEDYQDGDAARDTQI